MGSYLDAEVNRPDSTAMLLLIIQVLNAHVKTWWKTGGKRQSPTLAGHWHNPIGIFPRYPRNWKWIARNRKDSTKGIQVFLMRSPFLMSGKRKTTCWGWIQRNVRFAFILFFLFPTLNNAEKKNRYKGSIYQVNFVLMCKAQMLDLKYEKEGFSSRYYHLFCFKLNLRRFVSLKVSLRN